MKLSKLGRALEWMHDHSKLFSGVMLVAMALLVIANFVFPAGYDRFFGSLCLVLGLSTACFLAS